MATEATDTKTEDKPKTIRELLADAAAGARACEEAAKRDQLDMGAMARFYGALGELFERESQPYAPPSSEPAPLGAAAPAKPLG